MRPLRAIACAVIVVACAPIGKAPSIAAVADGYTIRLQATEAGGGPSWRYTITKTSADAQSLKSFVVDLGSCYSQGPTIASFVSATVNGTNWLDRLVATEGARSCRDAPTTFVKFDRLPAAETYVIEFTLNDVYAVMDSTAWLDTGSMCQINAVPGPGCRGYLRTSSMDADPSLLGKSHTEINTYMRTFGFDYTENPHCSGGYGAHDDGVHGDVDFDRLFQRYVFRFFIHIDPVIDGDRCSASTVDRQRNEMKSITNNTEWAKVQGNWDEWQILEWKFKLPAGLQPTANFFHIHQLKAQDGPNNGAPTITITPRANSTGTNKRIQIIHDVDGLPTAKGTIVDNIPLSDFEDEWVQVREEIHYHHNGFYAVHIRRIRDGRSLIDFRDDNIDMWRVGSSYIRSKFGLYRSLAGGQLNRSPVGQSPLLKNEWLWLSDFRVYEKNPNPTPNSPH